MDTSKACADCGKHTLNLYKRKEMVLVDKKKGTYQVKRITYVCERCV